MFTYYLVVRGANSSDDGGGLYFGPSRSFSWNIIELECAFNLFIMKTVISTEIKEGNRSIL